jgi:hypothetical protein
LTYSPIWTEHIIIRLPTSLRALNFQPGMGSLSCHTVQIRNWRPYNYTDSAENGTMGLPSNRLRMFPFTSFPVTIQNYFLILIRKNKNMKNIMKGAGISSEVQRWVTSWMISDSGPSRGWEFFSSPPCPDRLWGPPSLLSKGYRGPFLWEWTGRGVKLTTYLHLMPRSRMRGAIAPLPNTPS